MSIPLKQFYHC